MPITKERLVELVTAARLAYDTTERISKRALEMVSDIQSDQDAHSKLLDLQAYISEQFRNIPVAVPVAITREETWSKLRYNQNERSRIHMKFLRTGIRDPKKQKYPHIGPRDVTTEIELTELAPQKYDSEFMKQPKLEKPKRIEDAERRAQIAHAIGQNANVFNDIDQKIESENDLNLPERTETETEIKLKYKDGREAVIHKDPDQMDELPPSNQGLFDQNTDNDKN